MASTLTCLYCQSPAEQAQQTCSVCGMPLPDKHPQRTTIKRQHFLVWFVIIVLFCLIMMWYLPR